MPLKGAKILTHQEFNDQIVRLSFLGMCCFRNALGWKTSYHLSSSETQRRKCIQSLLFRPCQWWLSTSVRKYTGPLGFAKWYAVIPLKFNIKNNSTKVWKGVTLFIAIIFSIDLSDPYGERLSFGGWVLKHLCESSNAAFQPATLAVFVSLVAVVDIFCCF